MRICPACAVVLFFHFGGDSLCFFSSLFCLLCRAEVIIPDRDSKVDELNFQDLNPIVVPASSVPAAAVVSSSAEFSSSYCSSSSS